jgi:c-di-GMP-binding flagellar brake protein YcgR
MAAALRTLELLTVRDISWRGVLVESSVPLPLESVQSLRFSSGDLEGEITARVRHIVKKDRHDGSESYRIGLEFLDVQPALREELGRLTNGGAQSSSEA